MLCVSAEAEPINQFHSLCLTPQRPQSTIYHTRGEHANHSTPYTIRCNYIKTIFSTRMTSRRYLTYQEDRRSPSVFSVIFLFFCLFVCLFVFFFNFYIFCFAIEFAVLRFTAFVLYNGCKFSKHRKNHLQYEASTLIIPPLIR
jgi:hypothetical protein